MTVSELLLVSPPDYATREFRGAQPLGIAYLAAALSEQGIPCQLLDANVGEPLPLGELTAAITGFVARSKAGGGRPVVGLSVVSQVMHTCASLAASIKAAHPDTLIIAGGYHPTFAHHEILSDFAAIDLCVRGEAEETLVEIMQRWQDGPPGVGSAGTRTWEGIAGVTWRQGEQIVANPGRSNRKELDEIPFPARDLLPPLEAYPLYADAVSGRMRLKASLMSSRGCPFHCNFCSIITFYGDAGGKPWRGRSVENVVAEMRHLAERYGASHFEFQDDNFFVQPQRAQAIVETLAATGLDFSFAFLTRADQIVRGERFFPALRRAGLRYVSVGIESGSPASLERMVKQTTVEINRRALEILHENDVAAQVEFIMFEPGSTLADLEANLRFIEQQGLFGYFPPLIFSSLLLLPGTPVRAQAAQELRLQGSIHEALPYRFGDPRVAQVSDLLDAFQQRIGNAWYDLAFQLLDGIPALEISAAAPGTVDPRQLALFKLEFFALTRIPYGLMRSALDVVARGEAIDGEGLLRKAAADVLEVAGRVRPYADLLAAGARTLP